MDIMRFVSSNDGKNDWIDEYLLQISHNTTDINAVKRTHRYEYLASYVFFMKILSQCVDFPSVLLYNTIGSEMIDVDMVVDIGNSKTTAILFENSDLTKASMLELQNFSRPDIIDKSPFDMQLVFHKADFGNMQLDGTGQFNYTSLVRLGSEAQYLLSSSSVNLMGKEAMSICSSPKRYLWDTSPNRYEWEFIRKNHEERIVNMWVEGLSQQLNADGSFSEEGIGGIEARYSRRSLMTLSFVEMIMQATMQTNGYHYRTNHGNPHLKRRINRIIVTCPTAMSSTEQNSLRQAAAEARLMLNRIDDGSYEFHCDLKEELKRIDIIPSIKVKQLEEEERDWIYDEATCSQILFLCAEITKRYKNDCSDFFQLYGHVRSDLDGYKKKSLTIGSIDIGAGTTDVMVAAYKYDDVGQTTLQPVPLFWESFNTAGDDLLKTIVQQLVIEGQYSMIASKLEEMGVDDITVKLADFFGPDNNRMTFSRRKLRKSFNMQVSVPIALRYLQEAGTSTTECTFNWDDFFTGRNYPTSQILDDFYNHFGFRIEVQQWQYNSMFIDGIISLHFDTLLKKISTVMTACGCDIVLLAGRPTSLRQIKNMLLKYYPVSPNRIKSMSDYRVGRWYPFQNGDGYFEDQKSVVAVGALLGHIASKCGGFCGLSLDLEELSRRMTPTTEYFGILNDTTKKMDSSDLIITPQNQFGEFTIASLPIKIGACQVNSPSYPSRPYYFLDFNYSTIEKKVKEKGLINQDDIRAQMNVEINKIRSRSPLHVSVSRNDYPADRETLTLESVTDNDFTPLPTNYFSLYVKSLVDDDYWLDTGAFNLSINVR